MYRIFIYIYMCVCFNNRFWYWLAVGEFFLPWYHTVRAYRLESWAGRWPCEVFFCASIAPCATLLYLLAQGHVDEHGFQTHHMNLRPHVSESVGTSFLGIADVSHSLPGVRVFNQSRESQRVFFICIFNHQEWSEIRSSKFFSNRLTSKGSLVFWDKPGVWFARERSWGAGLANDL